MTACPVIRIGVETIAVHEPLMRLGDLCREAGRTLMNSLRLAVPISRVLGHTGINIVTTSMGLILAAISIEFIATGSKVLFG